jgi:hypothetical protein
MDEECVRHRYLCQAIADTALLSLPLAQPNPGKFGVGEQAGRHMPPGRHAVTTRKVVKHHPKRIRKKKTTAIACDRRDQLPNKNRRLRRPLPLRTDPKKSFLT